MLAVELELAVVCGVSAAAAWAPGAPGGGGGGAAPGNGPQKGKSPGGK